jgi:hypothetical protein
LLPYNPTVISGTAHHNSIDPTACLERRFMVAAEARRTPPNALGKFTGVEKILQRRKVAARKPKVDPCGQGNAVLNFNTI